MKRVNTREFQLNVNKYLKELPIMLTKHKKDIAIVNIPEAKPIIETEKTPRKPFITKPPKNVNISKCPKVDSGIHAYMGTSCMNCGIHR